MHGIQGGKWEKVCHLILKLKLDLMNEKMGEEAVARSFITKRSCQTKALMAMVKAEKATTKEAYEARKLVKLVATTKLSLTKGLPKTPKGEKEEPLPCNPEIEKEGHRQGRNLPKRELPRTLFEWWNSSNLPLIP